MLIAYLDEFGHQGPYISRDHRKFNTHPCFGYAGYLLPADNVRKMGGHFKHIKETLLAWEIERSPIPSNQWEKKGASLLTTTNISKYKDEIIPALSRIFKMLGKQEGEIFFYGQQKPIGPVGVTKETSQDRENHCLIQAINRLGTYATSKGEQLMVIMDATETHNRERAVATLGATIYSRSNKDNKSIIEIPLQTESHLYNTVQLADWVCALMGRLTDYHFVEQSEFSWSVPLGKRLFKEVRDTKNSIIWSNASSKDSTYHLSNLIQDRQCWKIENDRASRRQNQEDQNQRMLQRMISAGSPEFIQKLEAIKNGDPEP